MGGATSHKQVRTTSQLREAIRCSHLPERALAEKYDISRMAFLRRKHQDSSDNPSHRPYHMHTTLTPAWVSTPRPGRP
jgi:hypothetical protein